LKTRRRFNSALGGGKDIFRKPGIMG